MLRNACIILFFSFALCLVPQIASSQNQDNIRALDNLSSLNAYFDVKADSAAKVEKRLAWIKDIYEEMNQRGLKATFVIGIRSHASFYVTKGDEYVDEEDLPTKEKIEKWITYFVQQGIRVEQCGLTAGLFDIDTEDFLSEITVVKNGFVSMIGYQNKGYAYVPM